jgi:hypothetical protein
MPRPIGAQYRRCLCWSSTAKESLPHAASGLKRLSKLAAGTSRSLTRDGLLLIHLVVECGRSSLAHIDSRAGWLFVERVVQVFHHSRVGAE